MKKPLKIHWSSSKPNFGDALSPLICEAVSGRQVIHSPPNKADIVAIGSLLQRLGERWFHHKVHVWGSGFIESQARFKSKHIYHALRGKLSQTIIAADDTVLGDPGLLADILIDKPLPTPKYKVGFIEHYKDNNNPLILELANTHQYATKINIFTPPITFLQQLSECEFIFSSAMHGLIAADSLGIPNAWIKLSDQLRGHDFKFKDYYSAFDIMTPTPAQLSESNLEKIIEESTNEYARPRLDEIKNNLIAAFPDL
jgi:hypothetical protein